MSRSMLTARNTMAAKPTGSYLLTGDYGAFKTWLAACQFNWMIDHWPAESGRFITDIDLFRSLRDHELGRPATITPEDFTRGRIRHLIIDDLGKKSVSEFVRWAYYELIDAIFRSGGKVGLTITTNSTLGDLAYGADGKELYNPAMVRRVEQYCTLLRMQYGK